MILGGGFTQMHQDGHGTVDSGHYNLSGYNEVVMLRRLSECHKLNACVLIPQHGDDCKPTNQAVNMLPAAPCGWMERFTPMADNRDHQKFGELEVSAQCGCCGGVLLFACV